MLQCLRCKWRGGIKDNCHFGDQTVQYVVQAALSLKLLVWKVPVMEGRLRVSTTTLLLNSKCWAFLWIWSLQVQRKPECQVFTFLFLFHPWRPHLICICVYFPLALWHVGQLETFYGQTHSASFSFCLFYGMLSGVHLYWQRSSMAMRSPVLGWKTPAWIETSEEMSGDPPRRRAHEVIIGDSKGNEGKLRSVLRA